MRFWGIAAFGMALAACERPVEAPTAVGVCWRVAKAADGKVDFRPFATGIENLESCAARLEAMHVEGGQPVTGAFQGRFVFVSASEISAAPTLKGQRYRVFDQAQREEIRRGIRTLQAQERAGG